MKKEITYTIEKTIVETTTITRLFDTDLSDDEIKKQIQQDEEYKEQLQSLIKNTNVTHDDPRFSPNPSGKAKPLIITTKPTEIDESVKIQFKDNDTDEFGDWQDL